MSSYISTFQSFSEAEWADWLNAFLCHEPCEPELPLHNDEVHHAVIRLCHALGSKPSVDRLGAAVAGLYDSSPQIEEHAEFFYYLIQVIMYVKPPAAKRLLRRDLINRVFVPISHDGRNLHTEVLLACGTYDVDDELANDVFRSADEIEDFQYQLACLNVLVNQNDDRGYLFLEKLLFRVEADIETAQFTAFLGALLEVKGYMHLYRWYIAATVNVSSPLKEQFEKFERFLRDEILPDWDANMIPFRDPFQTLLSAQMQAKGRLLAPEEILEIARLHRHFKDIEVITVALENLWRKIDKLGAYSLPWEFQSFQDYGNITNPSLRQIKVADYEREFDARLEPKLDLIFERVRNTCEERRHLVAV